MAAPISNNSSLYMKQMAFAISAISAASIAVAVLAYKILGSGAFSTAVITAYPTLSIAFIATIIVGGAIAFSRYRPQQNQMV